MVKRTQVKEKNKVCVFFYVCAKTLKQIQRVLTSVEGVNCFYLDILLGYIN